MVAVLLFSFSAFAASQTNYTTTGGSVTPLFHPLGSSIFPSSDEISYESRSLSSPRHPPVVADTDRDGVNEIFQLETNNIAVYQGHTLTAIGAMTLPSSNYAPLVIHNMDSDDKLEIVLVEDVTRNVTIINFSKISGFTSEAAFVLPPINAGITSGDLGSIGCQYGTCGYVAEQTGGVSAFYGLTVFNKTGYINMRALQNGTAVLEAVCAPYIRAVVPYSDTTGTVFAFTGGDRSNVYLALGFLQGTSLSLASTSRAYAPGSSTTCSAADTGRRFTAPYVAELDAAKTGNEIVIGYNKDADEFKMGVWSTATLAQIDEYPSLSDADGVIISNVFQANAFPGTDGNDFCVMGYWNGGSSTVDSFADVLCASTTTSLSIDTYEFRTTPSLNITPTPRTWSHLTHGTDMVSSSHTYRGGTGTVNPSEVVSGIGVFQFEYSGALCEQLFNQICTLAVAYDPPFINASFIPVDVEQNGRNDLLVTSNTNIYYLDDGFSNDGCGDAGCLGGAYSIRPCLTEEWLTNTTVRTRFSLTDIDDDDVSMKTTLYADTPDAVSSDWSSNFSSGTEISQSLTANVSSVGGILRIQARDTGKPSSIETLDFSIVGVGSNGVTNTECETTGSIEDAIADANAFNETNEASNAARTITKAGSEYTGFSEAIVVLIIMFVIALAVWFKSDASAMVKMGAITIIDGLLYVIALSLGYFGIGSLIILVIIAVLSITFIMVRRSASGGG